MEKKTLINIVAISCYMINTYQYHQGYPKISGISGEEISWVEKGMVLGLKNDLNPGTTVVLPNENDHFSGFRKSEGSNL